MTKIDGVVVSDNCLLNRRGTLHDSQVSCCDSISLEVYSDRQSRISVVLECLRVLRGKDAEGAFRPEVCGVALC